MRESFVGRVIGDYNFKDLIGIGGFSSIYLVESKKYQHEFVAKVFFNHKKEKTELFNSFMSEYQILSKLDHINIIKIYESLMVDGVCILILEFCKYSSLNTLIDRKNIVSIPELVNLSLQIVEGVSYLHKNNIAHLDIKPQNILLNSLLKPKIIDFGISIETNESLELNQFKGTNGFIAPEILTHIPYNPFKADIWSLGMTFYFMFTGEFPKNCYSFDDYKYFLNYFELKVNKFPNVQFSNLIRNTLSLNPNFRLSLTEIKNELKCLLYSPLIINISNNIFKNI